MSVPYLQVQKGLRHHVTWLMWSPVAVWDRPAGIVGMLHITPRMQHAIEHCQKG